MELKDIVVKIWTWLDMIMGGDFNLVSYQKDKSNGNVDLKWCDLFNEWINKFCLMEIKLQGRCFTWSNN
jgi:hypothetical protein